MHVPVLSLGFGHIELYDRHIYDRRQYIKILRYEVDAVSIAIKFHVL